MPENDRHRQKVVSTVRPSRRRFVAGAGAASIASVAGCISGEEDDETPEPGNESGDGSEETPAEDAEPVADTITVRVNRFPDGFNLNPWGGTADFGNIMPWISDIIEPVTTDTYERYHSGHTRDIDGREVSVPCLAASFEVDPPYRVVYELDDRITYWDGTTMDAQAVENFHLLGHLTNYENSRDNHTWGVALDDQTVELSLNPETSDGYNEAYWPEFVHMYNPEGSHIWHPDFTGPYIERLEDASSEDEHDTIVEELTNETIDLYAWADDEHGAGPYRLNSEDIGEQSATLRLREDHPGADNIGIPNLKLEFAEEDRYDFLLADGEIDIFNEIVQEEGGQYNRQSLPDHIQEIDSYSAGGGDQLHMNWENKHIERLNVRRAIVAAVPWQHVGANGWGPENSMPIDDTTFMYNTANEQWFDEEFLDSLYDWPIESDEELATELMEDAGYTMEDGVWVDREGEAVELNFITDSGANEWIAAAQTIHEALQAFGFRMNLENLEFSSWEDRLTSGNYDLSMLWHTPNNPIQTYESHNPWWHPSMLYGNGTADDDTWWRCDPELGHGETDIHNRTLWASIPEDNGALYIDGEDYSEDNQSLYVRQNGELIHLCGNVRDIRSPETDFEGVEEIAHEMARWANYGIPSYAIHETITGIGGNVRDFEWAPRGHKVNKMQSSWNMAAYQILAGIVQPSYDEEYPEP